MKNKTFYSAQNPQNRAPISVDCATICPIVHSTHDIIQNRAPILPNRGMKNVEQTL